MFLIRNLICLLAGLILSACTSSGLAPVVTKGPGAEEPGFGSVSPAAGHHVVVRGDTLYSIAWRYGLDYRSLARWNKIQAPYLIYPGRRLALKPQEKAQAAHGLDTVVKITPPRTKPTPEPTGHPPQMAKQEPLNEVPPPTPATTPPTSKPALLPSTVKEGSPPPGLPAMGVALHVPKGTVSKGGLQWQWPATGQIQRSGAFLGREGLAIRGQAGQPVKAAATGEVVYSGDGLIGYGRLIIIKHNDTYLSAYAHNRKLLVKEGSKVVGGQTIAEMGNTGAKEVKLYFEIRRDGKPVPPLEYLPKPGV